ncbi:MAG: hypothetical protein RLZ60_2003, partial [Pseudomonadota bacterium]
MTRIVALLFFLVAPVSAQADCLVLIHGLARTGHSFFTLGPVLTRHGHDVHVLH